MAQLQKLEGQVELNCCADKLFGMVMAKQPNFHNLSNQVHNCKVLQDNCITVGSTRKWDFVMDGKSQFLIEMIEEIDEKNRKVHRKVIEGELMKDYKTLTNTIEIIQTGDATCKVAFSLEYEKINEDAPEPHNLLQFSAGFFKEVACHFTN